MAKKKEVRIPKPRGGAVPTVAEVQAEGVTEFADMIQQMMPAIEPFMASLRAPRARSPYEDLLDICNAGALAAEASASYEDEDDVGMKWDLIADNCASIATRLAAELDRVTSGQVPGTLQNGVERGAEAPVDDTDEILGGAES